MILHTAVLLTSIAITMGAECVTVRGDTVVAADLVKSLPAFSALPQHQVLLRAPVAGATRWVGIQELTKLLDNADGGTIPRQGICIISATRHLEHDVLLAILTSELGQDDATLEIIDFSRYTVPDGEIQFSRSGLIASAATRPDQPVLWKGRALAPEGRSTPIWVRLKIHAERKVLVATHRIPPGKRIEEQDVTYEQRRVFPLGPVNPPSAEDVIGRVVKRRIAAGEPVLATALTEAAMIVSGQQVTAEVSSGPVRLRVPASAETTGRAGDLIWVRPVAGGKRFRGRVAESGIVIVESNEQ